MNLNKASLHIAGEPHGSNNYPFTSGPEGIGFKNMLYSFPRMREVLAELGMDLSTKDINLPEESFLVIAWDNPHMLHAEKLEGQLWCLMINDPPIYYPESWDPKYHERFDYVLTFDETLVDNKKYFYYPFAIDTEYFSIPDIVSEEEFVRRRLATFVSHAIHKYPDPNHQGSTLHLRYNTISWYGRNHPDDFRFYGGTFVPRNYYFGFRGIRLVNRILPQSLMHSIAKLAQRDLIKVYGGELGPLDKFDVIKKYNFYYCYENTVGINGYVCEKIFDCLYNGIVPIYWGAPNIRELIPYDCYIDGRDFNGEKDLYNFIKSMDYSRYRKYLEEAVSFLSSSEMERFTVSNSVKCILSPMMDKIKNRHLAASSAKNSR
jgi:alpha(1,3/1,4) fucosyltransferase